MKNDIQYEYKNEQRNELDNDLMILIIRRILEDKPFGELDVNKFQRYFINCVWDFNRSEKETQAIIKRFNQALPNFFNGISQALQEISTSHKLLLKLIDKERNFRASLPAGVSDQDHPEVIKLARMLTEQYYTFSDAEKLVNTSRQTLNLHARKYQFGLRLHYPTGKSPKLLREDLINYFRERFHKNYNFLIELIESATYKAKGRDEY